MRGPTLAQSALKKKKDYIYREKKKAAKQQKSIPLLIMLNIDAFSAVFGDKKELES